MKKTLQISLLAAATLLSTQAFAAAPKWDLVELDYVKVDNDDTNVDPNGFAIMGSKLLTDNIYITGSYSQGSDDVSNIDIDYNNWSLGLGYRLGLTDNTDWYSTLSYVDLKSEAKSSLGFSSADEDGFGLSTGVRSMLTENFELAGEIAYVDIGDADETTFSVKGYYYVTDEIALSAGYGRSHDTDSFEIGARWAF